MKIIGVIPARYESSRFPGKPLAKIIGKPMVWWVYHQCKAVQSIDEIYVATDNLEIYEVCKQYGIDAVMTSTGCKTGSDRVAEAAKMIEGDLFINIQGDEPVIPPAMIQQVIDIFEDKNVYFGTLMTEIEDIQQMQAESTVKVVTDINSDALYFSRSIIPSNYKDGRLAKTYRHVGIYAFKKDFLLKFHNLKQSKLELGEGIEPLRALENGYKIKVLETKYKSIGVDYPEHIRLVEEYIKEHGLEVE